MGTDEELHELGTLAQESQRLSDRLGCAQPGSDVEPQVGVRGVDDKRCL